MRSRKLLKIRKEVIQILKKLCMELDAKIYLFGSYARGDYTIESDIDVIVVSPLFKGKAVSERVAIVRSRLPEHLGFDIIALTPDEFRRKLSRSFFRDISKQWIEIT